MSRRSPRMLAVRVLILALLSACSGQQTAESVGEPVTSEAPTAIPEPSVEATETDAPSPTAPPPTAQALAACDLVLDASAAPEGTSGGEPRLETLDDLRADVEAAAEGSPARAAAEANFEAYESMGLVERCAIVFGDAAGARLSSAAFIFEDDRGSAAYLDFLSEGCEAGELPASATIDATVIVCPALFPPIAYVATTDGAVVQTASASPSSTGTIDEAVVEQAVRLLEEVAP